jgi:hypothetical protein
MTVKKLPKGACRFVEEGCHAVVEEVEKLADDGKKVAAPKLKMVGYSGGIIEGHWYWGRLAIDLSGLQFRQKMFPILEEHNGDKKIAFGSKPVIVDGKLCAPEDAKFTDTPASQEFQRLSSQGFPYQSSIYAKPTNIERLEEGGEAEVNGYKFKGPGAIWRKSDYKEMSVCVFGWDSNTAASAFSHTEEEEVDYTEAVLKAAETTTDRKEVNEKMDLKELQEKHPEVYAQAIKAGADQAKTDSDKLATQMQEVTASVTQLTKVVEDLQAENTQMAKDVAVSKEEKLAMRADVIFTDALSRSIIPDRLYGKVKRQVSYQKFVDDKGVLDETKFKEAIKEEVADWEKLGVKDEVLGTGFAVKDGEDGAPAAESAETLAQVNRLRGHVGMKKLETATV